MNRILKLELRFILISVLTLILLIDITGSSMIAFSETKSDPKITSKKILLYVGYKTYQIEFINLSLNALIKFKSDNTRIAKVSTNGIITPIAKGQTTITASIKQNNRKYSSKIDVSVSNPYISISSHCDTLNIGEQFTYKAKAFGTYKQIEWSVSDSSIASIDRKSGKLKAISCGRTHVIATAGDISEFILLDVWMPEDENKSKSLESSQYIPAYSYVYGSLGPSNMIDYYQFKVNDLSNIRLCLYDADDNDFSGVASIRLIDENNNIVQDWDKWAIDTIVEPGNYYIAVYKPDSYKKTINYYMYVSYWKVE